MVRLLHSVDVNTNALWPWLVHQKIEGLGNNLLVSQAIISMMPFYW